MELSWTLPSLRYRLNGIVRSYTIYVQKFNGSTSVITLDDNATFSYIITGLEPLALYTFSMSIRTVADGPRGIHLDVTMPDSGIISYSKKISTEKTFTFWYKTRILRRKLSLIAPVQLLCGCGHKFLPDKTFTDDSETAKM